MDWYFKHRQFPRCGDAVQLPGGLVTQGTWSADMVDTITARLVASRDDYNAPTFGSPIEVACKYEAEAVRFTDDDGDGEVFRMADLFATHDALDADDLQYGGWRGAYIWAPGVDASDNSLAMKVSLVRRATDLDGADLLFEVTV